MHNMLSSITCWYASRLVSESWHRQLDFVGINLWLFQHQYYLILQSEYYSILPKGTILLNITDNTQYFQYYSILHAKIAPGYYSSVTNITNITNITQYYQYYPILHAKIAPGYYWIASGYYSSVTNITQYYQYYQYCIILPILHNITHQRFTIITQYFFSNITLSQYSIGGIQYQYYSILPILLNITYSILPNIPKPQNCAFPIEYVSIFINITSHFQYSSIFLNITWATWRWSSGPGSDRPGRWPIMAGGRAAIQVELESWHPLALAAWARRGLSAHRRRAGGQLPSSVKVTRNRDPASRVKVTVDRDLKFGSLSPNHRHAGSHHLEPQAWVAAI